MKKECYAKSSPPIAGHQADTRKNNGSAEIEFLDGVGKSKKGVESKIEIVKKQSKAFEDLRTASSSKKASSNKSANDK